MNITESLMAEIAGRCIQDFRKNAGLSRRSLAEKLGRSVQYIQEIEDGDFGPLKQGHFKKIAMALGVTTQMLGEVIALSLQKFFPRLGEVSEKEALKECGEMYRQLRIKRGLSVEKVMKMTKLTHRRIVMIENGTWRFDRDKWMDVCTAIRYEPSEVIYQAFNKER